MNQKGITLLEMVLCVFILGIIALIASKQFKTTNRTITGNQSIIEQQTETRSALHIMSIDLKNTGCKNYLIPIGFNTFSKGISLNAFLSGSDSSSFIHCQGNPGDTLTIYKARLDESGEYLNDDSITYYLDSTNLIKKHNNNHIKIAEYVYALQFSYGIFTDDTPLLDQIPITSTENWKVSNNSGPAPVKTFNSKTVTFSFSGQSEGKIYYYDFFSISSEQKVTVELQMKTDASFFSQIDSMHCSLMDGNTILGTDKFLPGDPITIMTFPVRSSSNAHLAIRYWVKGSGSVTISGAEVKMADLGQYVWTSNPDIDEKKHVRAIRVQMLTRSQSQTDTRDNDDTAIGDVTVSKFGDYTWRSIDETINVPNNGIFDRSSTL